MSASESAYFPDVYGAVFCLLGILAQLYIGRRLGLRNRINYAIALSVAVIFCVFAENFVRPLSRPLQRTYAHDWSSGAVLIWSMFTTATAILMRLFHAIPKFRSDRRHFLRSSAAAASAVPAAVLGAGIITRKDFRIKEVDLRFPNLPKDLHGLRMLQISDIHMGAFFSRGDLARVIDASNGLRPEIAFITGDLITTKYDPLDACLLELRRLRAGTGIWGCMGNHELYAKAQTYTKKKARQFGIDFLRYEARSIRMGNSQLNLVGIDFPTSKAPLAGTEGLVSPDSFNILLSHTPEPFPEAVDKGFDLMLSGHTHGGQINLELLGTNFNLVSLDTPYTKGHYTLNGSSIYVNSGLGTIGVPVRIGAPPEITLIRLCNS